MEKNTFKRTLVTWILDQRFFLLGLILLGSIAGGYLLRDPMVLFQNYTEDSREDSGGEAYKEFANQFGDGELLLAVIQSEDIFSTEILSYITSLTKQIEQLANVQKVQSIINAREINVDSGAIKTSPFFPETVTDQDIIDQKKASILSNPLLAGNIVSTDASVTVIQITLPPLIRGSTDAFTVIDEIQNILHLNKPDNAEVFLTGLSPMLSDSMNSMLKDFKTFIVLTWLFMAGFLFFAFRTVRGVLLPLGVTILTVVWVLGLMVLTGQKLSMVGAMLPSLVGIICFSDTIHVLTHFDEQIRILRDKREIVLQTMEHMLTACFLTSITTATAFGSLVVANLSTIRQFGLWVAIGIMIGYILIIVLLPIALYILPLPRPKTIRPLHTSLTGKMLGGLSTLSQKKNLWIPLTTITLLIFAAISSSKLQVETSLTAFQPESSPSMQGLAALQGKLAGFGKVELVLECKEPRECRDGKGRERGAFELVWGLQELQKMQKFLEQQPDVMSTMSAYDFLQFVYQTQNQTTADLLKDPRPNGYIADYLFMFSELPSSQGLGSFFAEDYNRARITARLHASGAGEQVALLEKLDTYVSQHLDKRLKYHITGEAGRIAQQIESVLDSLLGSLGLTILVISLLMLWMMRSVKMTLFVMIPNILPVILTLGLMGVAGIKLNFATIMITSIAVGIAVDDTIHFLVRYIREIKEGNSHTEAVKNTILHSGRAIVLTSLIIASGCSIFALSEFVPSQHFGLLMAFAMIAALLTDLIILPYFLRLWKLNFNENTT